MMLLVALLLFPKLALGLSGFETGVAVMPLVKGEPGDSPKTRAAASATRRKLLRDSGAHHERAAHHQFHRDDAAHSAGGVR